MDIDEHRYNGNLGRIEAAISPRTKAILPVYPFGNPCDTEAIMDIAARHGLIVIENASEAHGATVGAHKVGSLGTGCFSFYPTKNVITAEGGIITTNDDKLADRARLIGYHRQRERGIGAMICSPAPVRGQVAYQRLGCLDHLPLAEQASRDVLSLPVQLTLTWQELDEIVEGVNSQWC